MESVVSLRRMQDFLVVQSSTAKPTTVAAPPQGTDPLAIDIRDAEFAWGDGDGDEEAPAALQHINLDVPFGTFVAIAGDVGSGKSSLLGAILGELRCSSGTCAVNGTVAFVPQTAWLMPASVRENVLLGAEYDVQRYRQVLHACALEQDLHSMPAGDATLVGESGSTLSGGQRARVALARALYHANTADIILLDDVLAAVDAHVAAWLVEHALKGPLLHGKTVIAATHSPLVLAAADVVVTIESGSIVGKEERATQRKDTSSASSSGMQSRLFKAGSEVLAMLRTRQSVPVSNGQALPVPGSDEVLEAGNSAWATSEPPPMDVPAANQGAELGPLQEEEAEEREIGHVKWHVYKRYMSLQGMWVPVTLVSLTLMQGTRNGSDLWLSYWVSHTDGNHTHASSSTNTPAKYDGFAPFDKSHGGDGGGLAPDVKFYLTVLLVLGAANSVFTLVRAFAFAIGGLAAARRIHCRLLSAVLAVPPTFFDSTPSGRILNRFSSDTATVDDGLPFIANIFLAQAFALAGALVVVGLTQPYLAAVFLPLTLVYRSMQQYYRSTSRELRRLDAVAKSPLYSLFSCALSGGPTLRAFRATPAFLRAGLSAVAAQQRAALASLAASAWLGLRLQLMAAVIAAGIAGLAVAQSSGLIHGMAQSAAAGFVGLSLAYVMPITGLLSELVSTGAETEQEMVAVERIEQYLSLEPQQEMLLPSLLTSGQPSIDRRSSISTSRGLAAALDDASQTICSPRTGLLSVGGHRAAPSPSALAAPNATAAGVEGTWPEAGAVSYSNVWLRYSVTGPFVVQHLTMHIPAGTKAGICGRTGAGKSSAVACLLRLAEVSAGEVIIDGVDVRQVPLKRLRSAIGYVPQSPFLFSGTIHENLDPMGRHSSDEVMTVLEHVGLWEPLSRLAHSSKALLSVQSEKAPLRLRLGEGGVSLSQGQQQMLCLARVLLQRPRIVCLDESTSSVDADSADAMHAVVAAELKGCTVIEIAHRLASLANSDVVYVMEGGQVVEQGNPRELVHKPESLFQKMVKEQHGSVVQAGCIAM